MNTPKLRRVAIVFQDGGGSDFSVFIEGIEEDRKDTPEDDWSPAEFYGRKMFDVVVGTLHRLGVVRTARQA